MQFCCQHHGIVQHATITLLFTNHNWSCAQHSMDRFLELSMTLCRHCMKCFKDGGADGACVIVIVESSIMRIVCTDNYAHCLH
jgi:hypothetical protein